MPTHDQSPLETPQPDVGSEISSSGCDVCGKPLRTRFASVRDTQSQQVFSILECNSCGLGHTRPRVDDLSQFYRDYHGGRHGFTAAYCTHRRMRFLRRMAGSRAGRLLDIGCGDGTFLLAARAKGWDVVGTEMNPEIARGLGLTVYTNLADVRGLAPFECITLWHTLEHMTDLGELVRAAHDLLLPAGVMIIAVPDARGLQACMFRSKWFHLDVPRHLYHFNRASLSVLLRSGRLTPVRSWHQEFEYDLLGWSQSALNTGPLRPNLFFDLLRGRKPALGPIRSIAVLFAGGVLTALALPLVWLGTLMSRGGTLIVAARRTDGIKSKN